MFPAQQRTECTRVRPDEACGIKNATKDKLLYKADKQNN